MKSKVYYVKVARSAVTGRFVTRAYARRYPAITIVQRIRKASSKR